jgi:hypothetical protein
MTGLRERLALYGLVILSISMTALQSDGQPPLLGLDGAYQFVSETTTLEQPRRITTKRNPPTWEGIVLFKDGFYSISLVDNSRNGDWFTKFPRSVADLGYESTSGKFEIEGTTLTLNPQIGLHPFFDSRIMVFDLEITSDTVKLTQHLSPYVEDLRKGSRVIVLSRLYPKTDRHMPLK